MHGRWYYLAAALLFAPQIAATAPSTVPITPTLEWSKSVFLDSPASNQVMMTPAIIDLSGDAIPDIVFTTFSDGDWQFNGRLRAISGNNGAELFTEHDHDLSPGAGIAVGNIDADPQPEIVTVDETRSRIIAFEHDGTLKWQSDPIAFVLSGYWIHPALADLDGDGVPEIIAGSYVLNNDGTVRWGMTNSGGIGISVVADIDLNGSPDVIAGNAAYAANGALLWQNLAVPDGYDAIGNFDGDPEAEVVVVGSGEVWVLEHDGSIKWHSPIPAGGSGGPPSVGDIDGDGAPEIGVSGQYNYATFETNGTLKWSSPIQDNSSVTSSALFDFDGDGSAEIIYRDETALRGYRGDGSVAFDIAMGSGTINEYPLVVDVDGDGESEIVATANSYYTGAQTGILVFGSNNHDWSPTRKIWNQHAYHVTNINDDGSIPSVEHKSWLYPPPYNSYRESLLPSPTLSVESRAPLRVRLYPGEPNPFERSTTIRFDVSRRASVHARIYDVRGRLVHTLADGEWFEPGSHTLTWDVRASRSRMDPGVYFCELDASNSRDVKRLVLLR